MALVDANYNFIYVDVGSEGRVADGGIWRDCSLQRALKNGSLNVPSAKPWPQAPQLGPKEHVIVADDAFAMSSYLLKPYSMRNLDEKQRIFNYRLSRARRVVENAFGIMSSRFRILLTNIIRSPDRVVQICFAIVALHNYLRMESPAQYLGLDAVDHEDANHNVIDGEWRQQPQLRPLQGTHSRNYSVSAKKQRDDLADYFCSEQGSVPWQQNAINN